MDRSLRIVERLRETSKRSGGVSLSQIAINWLMGSPGLTSVITGIRSPRKVDDSCAALDWQLPDAERLRLSGEIAFGNSSVLESHRCGREMSKCR